MFVLKMQRESAIFKQNKCSGLGTIIQKKGGGMMNDTRKKIDVMLDKITSRNLLERIYNFVKYIYIHQ